MYIPYSIKPFLFVALLAFSSLSSAEDINLPQIGDSGAAVITPEQERRTGEAVIRNIYRAGGIIDDPLLTEYINQLGFKLVSHSDALHKDFTFFLINDNDINAFALPGGFIGINYGLILSTQSESELASVMAHEIAHITQRHHARAYDLHENSNIPAVAALIAAIVLGANNSEVGQAAMASLAASSVQQQINFTRNNEKEADRIGIALLAKSGFDPYSMAGFFDSLQRQTRLYGPQAPEFLRTHPINENRIADANNRAASFPRTNMHDDFDFHLARARIRALASTDIKKTISTFENNLAQGRYSNKTSENYGYALALIKNENFNKARRILDKLLALDPQRLAYILAKAELHASAKEYNEASKAYRKALKDYPLNKAVSLDYVEMLLSIKQAQKAMQILKPLLREPNPHPRFYKLKANAEALLENQAASHAAMAEYYFHIGQTHQALDQLKIALKIKDMDFYLRNKLEARVNDFESELLK